MKRALVTLLAIVSIAWPSLSIAGTTGGLSGIVTQTGTTAPIAGARVTVTSPSQIATATTDASGRFQFVSLTPDEYVATIEKTGFEPASYPGIGGVRRRPANAGVLAAKSVTNDRARRVAQRIQPGASRHDCRHLFGRSAAARTAERARRRRKPQQRVFGDRQRPRRVRAGQSERLQSSRSRARRRRVRGGLRVRRYSRQPRVRQLSIVFAIIARTARTASVHRRHALQRGSARLGRVHQSGHQDGNVSGIREHQPEHRHPGLLS